MSCSTVQVPTIIHYSLWCCHISRHVYLIIGLMKPLIITALMLIPHCWNKILIEPIFTDISSVSDGETHLVSRLILLWWRITRHLSPTTLIPMSSSMHIIFSSTFLSSVIISSLLVDSKISCIMYPKFSDLEPSWLKAKFEL